MKKIIMNLLCIFLLCTSYTQAMQHRRRTKEQQQRHTAIKHRRKQWRARHAPRWHPRKPSAQEQEEHNKIVKKFLELQRQAGVEISQQTHSIHGAQATQAHFNKVRSELNTLLSQPTLESDKIRKKIAKLRKFNPARFPQAYHYKKLFRAMRIMKASTPQALQPQVQRLYALLHEVDQQLGPTFSY